MTSLVRTLTVCSRNGSPSNYFDYAQVSSLLKKKSLLGGMLVQYKGILSSVL